MSKLAIAAATIGAGKFLIGRKGFFFEGPDDNRGGGGGNPSPGNSATNQPPNNADPNAFKDPWEGVDLDMFDDQTRQTIEATRTQMKQLHSEALAGRNFQSQADRLNVELQRLQKQSQQPNQPPPTPKAEPTLEDELYQSYREEGLNEEAARAAARMNSKVFGKFANRFEGHIQNRFAPIAGTVIEQNAMSAFQQVQQSDTVGIFQNEALAQKVWDKTTELSQAGQMVTPQVVQNLARIYYMEALEAGEIQSPSAPTGFRPQPPQPPVNQQTRFTYPGAGHSVRTPVTPTNQPANDLDPDTFAAMGATAAHWPVQPKAFKGKTNNGFGTITRGGL